MSITSWKNLVGSGLLAITLVACGGAGTTDDDYTRGGVDELYSFEVTPEVEYFKCWDITPDAIIHGSVLGPTGMKEGPMDYEFVPSEMTIKVGDILQFVPFTATQNMASGYPPEGDDRFFTLQGALRCLRFNLPGDWPFFGFGQPPHDPMVGLLYVVE